MELSDIIFLFVLGVVYVLATIIVLLRRRKETLPDPVMDWNGFFKKYNDILDKLIDNIDRFNDTVEKFNKDLSKKYDDNGIRHQSQKSV